MALLEHAFKMIAYVLMFVGMITMTVLMTMAAELARSVNEANNDKKRKLKGDR